MFKYYATILLYEETTKALDTTKKVWTSRACMELPTFIIFVCKISNPLPSYSIIMYESH